MDTYRHARLAFCCFLFRLCSSLKLGPPLPRSRARYALGLPTSPSFRPFCLHVVFLCSAEATSLPYSPDMTIPLRAVSLLGESFSVPSFLSELFPGDDSMLIRRLQSAGSQPYSSATAVMVGAPRCSVFRGFPFPLVIVAWALRLFQRPFCYLPTSAFHLLSFSFILLARTPMSPALLFGCSLTFIFIRWLSLLFTPPASPRLF